MKLLRTFFFGFVCLFSLNPSPAFCITTIEEANQLIQQRHGSWISFKARVQYQTTNPDSGKPATCDGQLAFERLNERLMLLCVGSKKQLLFAFKAEDRNFEFYQPEAGTLYTGSIFDLEDAPDLHTVIKPLALYHALKFAPVPKDNTRIEAQDAEGFKLAVKSKWHATRYLKRRVHVSAEGDLLRETYYRPDGKEWVAILRSDYQFIKKQGLSKKEKYRFPQTVELLEYSEKGRSALPRKTVLKFGQFDFTPKLATDSWSIPVPPGTRRVNVSETFEKLEKQAA